MRSTYSSLTLPAVLAMFACSSSTTDGTLSAPDASATANEPTDGASTTSPNLDAAVVDATADADRTDAAKKKRSIEGPVAQPKACNDLCAAEQMVCVGSVDAAYVRPSTGGIRHRTYDCATAPTPTINLPSIAEDGTLEYYTCVCEEA